MRNGTAPGALGGQLKARDGACDYVVDLRAGQRAANAQHKRQTHDDRRAREKQIVRLLLRKAKKVLELQLPPKKPSEKPWWQKDWDDPISKRDRELFA